MSDGRESSRNWVAGLGNGQLGIAGPTPLIAAMRCYVAGVLGNRVEIPEELMPTMPATIGD